MTDNIDYEIARLAQEIADRQSKLNCLILEKHFGKEVKIINSDIIQIGDEILTNEQLEAKLKEEMDLSTNN